MSIGQRTSTPGIHRDIWHAATAYIDSRLNELLTVAQIARAALTSERQLQRVFAAEGASVRDYIAQARMRQAAFLVINSEAAVAEIARAVGYSHASAFIKAFREHHGITPTALRRQARSM